MPFFVEEVRTTLCDMNGNKALDPDCFITTFCQSCWDVVREDIMQMFGDFHVREIYEESEHNFNCYDSKERRGRGFQGL